MNIFKALGYFFLFATVFLGPFLVLAVAVYVKCSTERRCFPDPLYRPDNRPAQRPDLQYTYARVCESLQNYSIT